MVRQDDRTRAGPATGTTSGTASVNRQIVSLAVPALGALAVEPLYVLVDTAIVGHLGAAPLGGLALASTVLTSSLWVCNFLAWATTSRVAMLIGAGQRRRAAEIAVQGLWLCLILGAPLAVLIELGGPSMASVLGGKGAVLDAASTYLRISALGVPAVLVALAGNGYFRGRSDTVTPLRIVVVANALNVVLEVALVYGAHLGVAGSAWGTVAAQLVAAAWFAWLIARSVLRERASFGPQRAELSTMLTAGRQIFVRTGSILAAFALATAVAARLGTASLAAHQIAYQLFLFLALAVDALAIAGQAMVGTRLGAGDVEGARSMGWKLMRAATVVGLGMAAAVACSAVALPHAFTGSQAVASKAVPILLVLAVLQLPGAYGFVLDGVLMGGADFRFLQWAAIGALAVFAPFAAAVALDHSLGLVFLWVGLTAWMTTRSCLNAYRFTGARWAHLDMATPAS